LSICSGRKFTDFGGCIRRCSIHDRNLDRSVHMGDHSSSRCSFRMGGTVQRSSIGCSIQGEQGIAVLVRMGELDIEALVHMDEAGIGTPVRMGELGIEALVRMGELDIEALVHMDEAGIGTPVRMGELDIEALVRMGELGIEALVRMGELDIEALVHMGGLGIAVPVRTGEPGIAVPVRMGEPGIAVPVRTGDDNSLPNSHDNTQLGNNSHLGFHSHIRSRGLAQGIDGRGIRWSNQVRFGLVGWRPWSTCNHGRSLGPSSRRIRTTNAIHCLRHRDVRDFPHGGIQNGLPFLDRIARPISTVVKKLASGDCKRILDLAGI
jgi:hypothetical protein